MPRLLVSLSALALLAGCLEPVDPRALRDASTRSDAQLETRGDATESDAAVSPDASAVPDAGPLPDASPTLLPCEAWACDDAGACRRTASTAGEVCRPAAGQCDEAEACDGVSPDCPTDRPKPKATYCGNNSWCDGASTVCPPGTPDWETFPGSRFFWARPHPVGEDLHGLWTGASDDVWAVGEHGVALHWDGKAWSRALTGTEANLLDVFGFAPNDVWAVGANDTVIHWDGAVWSPVATNSKRTFQYTGVWGPSATDLWVVGFDWADSSEYTPTRHPPVVLRWDGSRWLETSTTGLTSGFHSVSGRSPQEVWLTGPEGTLAWNGLAWTVMAGKAPSREICALSPDGIWGVSASLERGVAHFDGSAWAELPKQKAELLSIGCFAASDLWAVGTDSGEFYRGGAAVAHWDGNDWSEYPLPGKTLRRIRGASPSDAWAIGDSGTLLHWDGASWAPAMEFAPEFSVIDLWGTSGSSWAVGGVRTVDASFNVSTAGAVMTSSGEVWLRQDVSPTTLGTVWGLGPEEVWTAGGWHALHWDGETWTGFVVSSDDSDRVQALWGSSKTDFWAVGARWTNGAQGWSKAPRAWHWDGAAWSERSLPATGNTDLVQVWGTSESDVWVIGNGGLNESFALHYDGSQWREALREPCTLSSLYGFGPSDVWASGVVFLSATTCESRVFHWDGLQWKANSPGAHVPLTAIWGSSPTDVWVSGHHWWLSSAPPQSAKLLHWDGATWTDLEYGSELGITSIWGDGADGLWLGGEGAAILHYRP